MRIFTRIFLLLPLTVIPAMADTAVQSRADFETAIRDLSTSPYYVLVTIVDDRNGQSTTRCVTANLFMGAIHREYGLAYNQEGFDKGVEIALGQRDHVFHFSNPAALANMPEDPRHQAYACSIIAMGGQARQGDRLADVYAVPGSIKSKPVSAPLDVPEPNKK